jgi:phosphoribosylaminoimidazole-succinocarboxamide synthase
MDEATLKTTDFHFPGQTGFFKGSVRDVYAVKDRYLAMVVTDRISTFDVVLPVTVPCKGQVLSQIAAYFLDATKDIVPNWLISTPDPNVVLGYKCQPYKVEMVIRGYLTGHAWREYHAGKRTLCGVSLPEGMQENEQFPEPIITPATHAEVGHDEDVSKEEIIARGLIPAKDYDQIETYTRALFERGTKLAAERGLILVDTKYEFGKHDGKLVLMDEVHTPDSSRYFYADDYEARLGAHEHPRQLSKEFVREWLMERGFQGQDGQIPPPMPAEFIEEISERYIELYERLTGQTFAPADVSNIPERIEANVRQALEQLP